MGYAIAGIGVEPKNWPVLLPYYGIIAAILTWAGAWREFALFWVLPYFTLHAFFHRVRNSSEHLALPKTHILNGTRNIVGSPLETFFFGPHNVSLHLVHHVFPFIPWYKLPRARAFLLANPAYARWAHENNSYFLPSRRSVYRDMTTPLPAADANSERRAA
jgi:fatty acid desaturase